jgi:mono/diheme cytochrome c family protein
MRRTRWILLFVFCAGAATMASAAERHLMQPRVPEDKLMEARALRNPLPDSADIVERGRALYHGKGICFTCHGPNGRGDGQAGQGLDPSPRDFRHHGFWRHRAEGEIFWVIKNGSPGTGMVGFGGVLTDEEIWSIIQYERSFAGEHGPMRRRGPDEGMGPMGPRRGMGREGMGEHGPRGGMDPSEEPCCDNESKRVE